MRGSKAMIVAVEAGCIGCLMNLAVATCNRYVRRRMCWDFSNCYELKTCSVKCEKRNAWWLLKRFLTKDLMFCMHVFDGDTATMMVMLNGCPVSNCSMLLCWRCATCAFYPELSWLCAVTTVWSWFTWVRPLPPICKCCIVFIVFVVFNCYQQCYQHLNIHCYRTLTSCTNIVH